MSLARLHILMGTYKILEKKRCTFVLTQAERGNEYHLSLFRQLLQPQGCVQPSTAGVMWVDA